MTQPPGPDEPAGPAQPADPAQPPLRPPFPGGDGQQPPPPAGPPQGYQPPPGYPAAVPYPPAYDPAAPYPVYEAAPTSGYGVPIFGQQAGYDPLISPDYPGWWRRTLAVLKPGWKPLAVLQSIGFVVSLIFSVPQAIYLVLLQQDLERATRIDPDTGTTAQTDLTPILAVFGIMLLGAFITVLVSAAVTIGSNHVVVSVATGNPARIGPALALAVRRMFPLIGWQILAGLIMVVGLCACILPFFYLFAVFLILPAVVTFERGSAIGRCFALFHRDLGGSISRVATIAGITIGAGVVGGIFSAVIESIAGAPTFTTSDARFSDLGATYIVAIVVGSVVAELIVRTASVFTAPLTTTAYADMRSRVEPLSTATLAAEIGLAPAATTEWTAPPPATA